MPFERSKGKARPTHVRSSDLQPVQTDGNPTEARGRHGHFTAGNRSAVGARFKNALKKSLGSETGAGVEAVVTRDAARVAAHVLRSLPSDAPPVRVLVTIHARHVALHGYYTARAEALGLDSESGLELLAVADRQSQRAERTLVTALDAARVCADQCSKKTVSSVALIEAHIAKDIEGVDAE